MRRRRTRRAGPARNYTIAYLLSRQPKSLQHHSDFDRMMDHYHQSERLQNLRFNRRCYSLLNRATVPARNLSYFYRTYRLPADPFFPLFFEIKRSYLAERERRKEERHEYILAEMRSLPPTILAAVKYLGYLEVHFNSGGNSPVWQKELFPGSKKKADSYRRYNTEAWITLFRHHLKLLRKRYRGMNDEIVKRTLACFVLEITPLGVPPALPSAAQVSRSYRRLSLHYHPDRGGNPALFIELKRARDELANGSPTRYSKNARAHR